MRIKIVLAASALALMATGAARAADVPIEAPVEIPVFTWTGFYVGLQGGYVWTNLSLEGGGVGLRRPGRRPLRRLRRLQLSVWRLGIRRRSRLQRHRGTTRPSVVRRALQRRHRHRLAGVAPRARRLRIRPYAHLRYRRRGVDPGIRRRDLRRARCSQRRRDLHRLDARRRRGIRLHRQLARTPEYRYYDFSDHDIDGAGGLANIDLDSQTVTVGIAYKF